MKDLETLLEIEAIKQLKYRYIRCLDLKRWDEIAECFCEDARAAYSDGEYSFDGRDQILEFFRTAMGPELITAHQVHQPEIELTGPSSARGRWAMEDTVFHTGADFTLRGAAFYEDEYVKQDGAWKIRVTGYERIFEETGSRKDIPGLRLTKNMWDDPVS